MTDIQLQNVFLHRKSYVTDSSLHESEPYPASPIILSHESLWIDSELMPNQIPLLMPADVVDTSNNHLFFDTTGAVVSSTIRDGQRVSAVQKKVRVELTRGNFGEYTSSVEDLRRVIHQNYGQGYSMIVEYESNGVLSILHDHLWEIQYMAGVVTIDKTVRSMIPQSIFITAYLYCGRVGIDKSIKDTTTDDLTEGVTNKFFTRDLLLSHITELATDNTTNFVISVANSDSLTEGVYNKFFNQKNFDTAFNSKYIDDLNESDHARLVTSETMSTLNLSIGGVSEVGFNVNFVPPDDTNAKLYVERGTAGENVLYFENKPIGATESIPSASPQHQQMDSLGNFVGYFEGPTRGVHTGDVKGNVQGFVSDLGNHPIIEAKILGSGEGHWVGTVNGDVVGKFEGHAKVINGSIDNASHITVGTFDSTASLHVKSSDTQVQISNTDGGTALIECRDDSCLAVSCSVFQTNSLVCETIDCIESLTANEFHANTIKCAGLTNSFYGIFETGRVEDVSEMIGISASLSLCSTEVSQTLQLSCADSFVDRIKGSQCTLGTISCNTCTFDELNSNIISVASFHVENLSFETSVFLDNPNIVFNTLSVSNITSNTLSLGFVRVNHITVDGGALMTNIVSDDIHADSITTQVLSVSSLHYPDDFSIDIRALSVQALSIKSGEADILSVASLFCDSCESSITKTSSLDSSYAQIDVLSASSIKCDSIQSIDMIAHNVSASSCSSVTMFSESLSSSSVFTNELSCSYAIADQASISSLDSTFIETQSINSQKLSAQTLFSNTISVDVFEGQTVSLNFAHIDQGSALSIASSFANVQYLSSTITRSNDLSVNSSHIDSLHTDTLSVNNMATTRLKSSFLSTAALLTDLSLVQNISCSNSIKALNINTHTISTGNTISDHIISNELSAHKTYSDRSILGLLSVSNATLQNAFSSILGCSAFTCDDITAPRGAFDILSVNSIVGVNLSATGGGGVSQDFVESLFLSVNESIETALNALSLQDIDGLNSLSCSAGKIDGLVSDTILVDTLHGKNLSASGIAASEIAVSALSVATLHGIVLTQELSVTGLVGHISTSSVTTSDLSCGTLFIDQIVRSIPHVSDTADPAVLTTSTVGDFALFAEDTKHSGDMVIEGSLYVTDTIFMGTQPSLNIENVQNLVASSISVGELAVGMLTGIGSGTLGGNFSDIVSNLLSVSPHDTVHEGNMQIEGNLVVSGVVLTGAHNKLMHNHGSFEMEGILSVSGDIFSNGINIMDTILSLQEKIDSIQAYNTTLKQHLHTTYSTDTGNAGATAFDTQHLYVCIAPNLWRRIALSEF